jgi:hypothetical protein
MSRNERREFHRQEDKAKRFIDNLTPWQIEVVEMLVNVRANERTAEFTDTLDRAISALLVESFPDKTYDDICKLEDYYAELVIEDTTKFKKIVDECGGKQDMITKAMQKYEKEIRAKGRELLEKGVNQKQAIEELVIKFPSLSKSMLTNAFKKLKAEWEESHKEDTADLDVQEAAETIMEIIEETEDKVEVDKIIKDADKFAEQAEKEEKQPKVICEGNSCKIDTAEVKEEIKAVCEVKNEIKKQGLKVLSMTVKGENGTYRVCEQGVELAGENQLISFGSEVELEEWVSEYKAVFAMAK